LTNGRGGRYFGRVELTRTDAFLSFVHDWSDTTGSAAATAERLARLTTAQRHMRALAHPEELTWFVLDALTDLSMDARRRDLALAEELAGFVEEHAVAAPLRAPAEYPAMTLRARAARERGNALRQKDQVAEALVVFERSAALYDRSPAAARDSAAMMRGIGLVQHQLHDSQAGLARIRAATRLFEEVGDQGGVALSLLYEASVLYEANDPAAAAPLFRRALEIAIDLHDEPLQAALLGNLAHCAVWTGQLDLAVGYFRSGLTLYDKHGMLTDRPRLLWGLARVVGEQGRIDEALTEFQRVAYQLRDAGMPLDAARAILDAIELAVMAERADQVGPVAGVLATLFTGAGLHREALRAFAYVRRAAESHTLTTEHTRHAWEFVCSLAKDEDAVFEPLGGYATGH
jgi:tetratricopeptide (TPR) repeat protein